MNPFLLAMVYRQTTPLLIDFTVYWLHHCIFIFKSSLKAAEMFLNDDTFLNTSLHSLLPSKIENARSFIRPLRTPSEKTK